MFKIAIPVLHVTSSVEAESFYCGKLGFEKDFAYRIDANSPDPCYMSLSRDDAWLHVSSFSGDGVSGAVAYLFVDDIDNLYKELLQGNVPISMGPTNQTWGNREVYVKDPDGNTIRFGQRMSG